MTDRERASEQADECSDSLVLFDGTVNRPWGPYLDPESSAVNRRYGPSQRPLRDAVDLSDDERRQIVRDARAGASVNSIVLRFHVHPVVVTSIIALGGRAA